MYLFFHCDWFPETEVIEVMFGADKMRLVYLCWQCLIWHELAFLIVDVQ